MYDFIKTVCGWFGSGADDMFDFIEEHLPFIKDLFA